MKRLKRMSVWFVVGIFWGLVFWKSDVMLAEATTTKEQIQQTTQEKNELENQLDQTQDDLEDLKGEHNNLKQELNNLNSKLAEISNKLSDIEEQIWEKEQQIFDTREALENAKETEVKQYEDMVKRVRKMYEKKETNVINAMLSKGGLSRILNAADYFEKISDYDKEKLEEYKGNRALIEEMEIRLQKEYTELENLKLEAEAEQSKVAGLINQTADSISQYADEISDAEQKALEYENEIKEKEADLASLQEKLKKEIEMSKQAANATWRDISEVSFAEGDRYLLANLIYCEAGGEPYQGQLAVGSVVMNRVLSSVYPNSIVGVIYQKGQFSPVASGRLELALAANKATESCYRAADEAMSGVTNVGNCVYFRTPIEGLSGIKIGGHIFY